MKNTTKTVKRVTRRRAAKPGGRVSQKVIRKANRRRKASGFEIAIHKILREERIPFTVEKTVGRLHVDLFIEAKTIIELNGCYWHGCRRCSGVLSQMQLDAQAKDARRYAFLQKLGFKVYVIWECELERDPDGVRELLRKIYKQASSE